MLYVVCCTDPRFHPTCSRVESAGAFDFTYGSIESILTPIFDFYPALASVGSPYNTGEELFGLPSAYKRAASLMGDIFFQVRCQLLPHRFILMMGGTVGA